MRKKPIRWAIVSVWNFGASRFTRDVYVALGEPLAEGAGVNAWSVRVYYKPFVGWIWGGCLLMAIGGAAAAADRRYRLSRPQAVPRGVAA